MMKLYYYTVCYDKDDSQIHTYPSAIKCRVGDTVVVGCCGVYELAMVVNRDFSSKEEMAAFIICNVTAESAKVNAVKNKIFRMEALRKAMETKLTESKFIEMCQVMAAQDPDLQALLNEYKVLTADVTEE